MYSLQVITPPASEPVTLTQLKLQLRLNPSVIVEDNMLTLAITTARQEFEFKTHRCVMPTTVRQYASKLPHDHWRYHEMFHPLTLTSVYLMAGDVQSIASVMIRNADGSYTADTTNTADLTCVPERIYWLTPPTVQPIGPVLYVQYVAGFAVLPVDVQQAILLRAAHLYEQRSSETSDNLKPIAGGFDAVCAKYERGNFGPWRM
jgi:uncharacterized phiE125 gp8 family phage protein